MQGLFNSSRANTPWLYLDIDRTKCMALGVPLSDVFNTLQVYLGSYYVNNFNEFGRTWQVNVQADQQFRDRVRDIRQLQVRNNQGQMVRLGTLMDVRDTSGPVMVMRYNMYSAAAITGNTPPGTSSGQAIDLMQEIADKRTAAVDGLRLDRADLHAAAGRQHGDLRLRAGRGVRLPGAGGAVRKLDAAAGRHPGRADVPALLDRRRRCWRSMDVNIFTQIGFVVLVGLASKNAILIVEFAKQQQEQGQSRARGDAGGMPAASAADPDDLVRLHPRRGAAGDRHGAGAEMRRTLGMAVFSGMLGVTLFGIFLTPVFFYVIRAFSRSTVAKEP